MNPREGRNSSSLSEPGSADSHHPPDLPGTLHAITDPASPFLAFYIETTYPILHQKKPGRTPAPDTPLLYPYATTEGIAGILSRISGHPPEQFRPARWIVHFPVSDSVPLTSLHERGTHVAPLPDSVPLQPWYVPVILCPFEQVPEVWKNREELLQEYIPGNTLEYLFHLIKFSIRLVRLQRFRPAIQKDGGRYFATWEPSLTSDESRWMQEFAALMPPVCRYVLHRRKKRPIVRDPDQRTSVILTAMMQQIIRIALIQSPPAIKPGRRMRTEEQNELSFLAGLTGKGLHVADHELDKRFALEMNAWLTFSGDGHSFPKFHPCIIMQEPPAYADEPWKLSIHLRSDADPSLIIPASTIWNLTGESGGVLPPSSYLHQELLSGIGRAVTASPVTWKYFTGTRPDSGECTMSEAGAFLMHEATAVREKGIELLLPAWWTETRPRARLELKAQKNEDYSGAGLLGIAELMKFDYRISIGEEILTHEEFTEAVALKTPFIRVGGRWVSCDTTSLGHAVKNFENRYIRRNPTAGDLIRLSLEEGSESDLEISIRAGDEWAADLLTLLKTKEQVNLKIPATFKGTLRKYQEEGHAFLIRCTERGFGACLADDMGLGKTPQTIAWLLSIKKADRRGWSPALLICPMSVVGNWERELARFAPSLMIWTHHGSSRTKGEEFAAITGGYDIVITTYHLAARDLDEMASIPWSAVILDEAQNIKNPGTSQTRAIKKLNARRRVALTGTPVENRLLELWSIMDFLNPGYLGNQTAFAARYSVQIEQGRDQAATAELRRLISPFILRRMKTDQSIISDLPEKMESRVYCSLTREQATLYQAVVDTMARTLDTLVGIERKGVIFSSITRLKQICNHPGLIARDHEMRPERSGKVRRVIEMLEEICDEGDSALIFSQYATFATEMADICRKHFSCTVMLLTGSTPRKEREAMISRYQSEDGPKIFVISLKAGGTGLNLTAATHVFHIDRWWNPAVEDQATDRSYRIGQKRNVQVHLMIAAGTLEERIDEINTMKRTLAHEVLAHGDDFLTNLSTKELMDIVTLRDSVFASEEEEL